MTSKADAAAFLHQLAQSTPATRDQPRVIMVRADRETKTFVARALESLDQCSQSLDDSVDTDTAQVLLQRFGELGVTAQQKGLIMLADTLFYAETLASLATGSTSTRAKSPAEHRWASVFSVILRNLSAALLRVYVDGDDHHCQAELTTVRRLAYQSSPRPSIRLDRTDNVQLLN